mgnify:CR=1 FL=1
MSQENINMNFSEPLLDAPASTLTPGMDLSKLSNLDLENIQTELGVDVDGKLGPQTQTAYNMWEANNQPQQDFNEQPEDSSVETQEMISAGPQLNLVGNLDQPSNEIQGPVIDIVNPEEGDKMEMVGGQEIDIVAINEAEGRRSNIRLEYDKWTNLLNGFINASNKMWAYPYHMSGYMFTDDQQWIDELDEYNAWMMKNYPHDPESHWSNIGGVGPNLLVTAAALTASEAFPTASPYIMTSYVCYMSMLGSSHGLYQAKKYEQEYLIPNGQSLSKADEIGITVGWGLAAMVTERIGMKYFKGMLDDASYGATNATALKDLGDSWIKGNWAGVNLGLKKVFKGAGIEGLQESGEQIWTDATDFLIYDKDAFVMNDVINSLFYGGISGGVLGGYTHNLTSFKARRFEKKMANQYFEGDVDKLRRAIVENASASEIKLATEYTDAYEMLMSKLDQTRFLEKVNEMEYSEEQLVNEFNQSLGVIKNKKQVIDTLTNDVLKEKSLYKIRKDGFFEIDNITNATSNWGNDELTGTTKTRINVSSNATDYQIRQSIAAAKFLQLKSPRFMSTLETVHFLSETDFKQKLQENGGTYRPGINGFFSEITPGQVYIKLNTGKKTRNLGSLISTFAHETLHNRDFRKWDSDTWSAAFIVSKGPNKGKHAGDPNTTWSDYRNVRGEDRAFSIGETAQRAYKKLADYIAEKFPQKNRAIKSGTDVNLNLDRDKEIIKEMNNLHELYMSKNIPTSEFVRDMMDIFPNKETIMPWLNKQISDGNVIYDANLLGDVFSALNPKMTDLEIQSATALIQAWADNLSDITGRTPSAIIGHYFKQIKAGNRKNIIWSTNGRAFMDVSAKETFGDLMKKLSTVFRRTLVGNDKEAVEKWLGVKNGKWTKAQENKFAKGFVNWLRTNKKDEADLDPQFEKIRKHLYHIYRRIKGSQIDVEMTPEIRAVFKNIVAQYNSQEVLEGAKDEVLSGRVIYEKIKAFWDAVDLEAPFKFLNAPKLGLAIKAYWGNREKEFAIALKVWKQIGSLLNNDQELMREFILMYETPAVFNTWLKSKKSDESMKKGLLGFLSKDRTKREAFKEAAEILDAYFGESLKQLQDMGVVKEGFVDNLVNRLNREITDINELLKGDNKLSQKELDELALDLKGLIEDLYEAQNNLNYVHIPVSFIFEKLINKERPEGLRQVKDYVNKKKRKSFSLNDLLQEQELNVSRDDIFLHDILFSYGRRLGQDLALGQIVQEAKNAGLAVKLQPGDDIPLGFLQVTAHGKGGPFVNYWIAPVVHEFITEFTQFDNQSQLLKGIDRFLAYTKMRQFIDPRFLVFYNAAQMSMAGSLSMPRIVIGGYIGSQIGGGTGAFVGGVTGAASPKWVRTGIWNYLSKNDAYREAERDGISSTPYPNPYDGAYDQFKRGGNKAIPFLPSKIWTPLGDINNRQGGFVAPLYDFAFGWVNRHFDRYKEGEGILSSMTKVPLVAKDLIDGMYNLSYYTAWSLDQMQRHITYAYMRDKKGLDSAEAAQLTAQFHGDYASVPWKTRNALNKIFFTPTYKIIMGKLFYNMFKSVIYDTPTQLYRTGKLDKPTQVSAAGLFRGILLLGAIDAMLMTLDFERDEWGRTYKKKGYKDPKGKPKEMVLTFSLPNNTFLRYLYRWQKVQNDPSIRDKFLTYVEYNKYDFHPLYLILKQAYDGEDAQGQPIGFIKQWNSERYATQKRFQYVLKEIYQVSKYFDGGIATVDDEHASELFSTDIDMLTETGFFSDMLEVFTFPYLRDEADIKKAKRIERLSADLKAGVDKWKNLAKEYKQLELPIPHDMRLDGIENMLGIIREMIKYSYEYEPGVIFTTMESLLDSGMVPEEIAEELRDYTEGKLNVVPNTKPEENGIEQIIKQSKSQGPQLMTP